MTGNPPDIRVQQLALNHIQADPIQVRREFDQEDLQQLADSIRAHGVIQPIVVQPTPPDSMSQTSIIPFQIIAGERRWRAAHLAGLEFIPAVIREGLSEQDASVLQVLENLQRKDLTLAEVSAGVAKLVTQFGAKKTAEQLSKSAAWVSRHAHIQTLPETVQTLVRDGSVSSAEVAQSLGELIEILGADHWRVKQSLDVAASGNLTRSDMRDTLRYAKEDHERQKRWEQEAQRRQELVDSTDEDDEDGESEASQSVPSDDRREQWAREEAAREARRGKIDQIEKQLDPLLIELYRRACQAIGEEPERDQDTGEVMLPEGGDYQRIDSFHAQLPSSWQEDAVIPERVEDCEIQLSIRLPLPRMQQLVAWLERPQEAQNTSVAEFLKAKIEKSKGAKLKASDLYHAYATYCTDNGRLHDQLPFNSNEFGEAIAKAKIKKVRSNGIRYVDIALRA